MRGSEKGRRARQTPRFRYLALSVVCFSLAVVFVRFLIDQPIILILLELIMTNLTFALLLQLFGMI